MDEGLEFYAQISFHFHQAAEKYLKAYIVANSLEFKKIHDLVQLLQICAQHNPDFNSLKDLVIQLNPFYIETRYPDFISSVSKAQADKALKATKEIAEFIKAKLS